MKKIEILALAVSAALVVTGTVVLAPSVAGSNNEDVRDYAQPTIQAISTSAVTRDFVNMGRYKTPVSVDVVPGVLDIQVQFYVRKKDLPETAQSVSLNPTISLRSKLTPASVLVDYQGNIIHGDFTEIAAFGYGAPQTFTVSDVIDNLECGTTYQVKFEAYQVLSGISNTVVRNPDEDSSYDTDLDGIPDEYDADSIPNIGEYANSYDEEHGWFDPATFYNAGDWTDLQTTQVCDIYGGGGGGGGGGAPAPAPSPSPSPTPSPTPTDPTPAAVQGSVYFGGDSAVLTKDAFTRISSLYSKIPSNAVNIKITFKGFVSPTKVTNYDRRLAAARVRNVKAQLLKRGIVAQVSIPTLAVDKKSAATKARRVDVIVTYDIPNN